METLAKTMEKIIRPASIPFRKKEREKSSEYMKDHTLNCGERYEFNMI